MRGTRLGPVTSAAAMSGRRRGASSSRLCAARPCAGLRRDGRAPWGAGRPPRARAGAASASPPRHARPRPRTHRTALARRDPRAHTCRRQPRESRGVRASPGPGPGERGTRPGVGARARAAEPGQRRARRGYCGGRDPLALRRCGRRRRTPGVAAGDARRRRDAPAAQALRRYAARLQGPQRRRASRAAHAHAHAGLAQSAVTAALRRRGGRHFGPVERTFPAQSGRRAQVRPPGRPPAALGPP